MKLLRSIPLLLLALLAAACEDDGVGPVVPEAMVGEWVIAEPYRYDGAAPPAPARVDLLVTFGQDGSAVFESRSWGGYGYAESVNTAWTKSTGKFRVDGDRLELRIAQNSVWNIVDGQTQSELVADAKWVDQGTVRVEGAQLTHTFVTAPLDVPIETTVVYRRATE